jgi:hypothetical protein
LYWQLISRSAALAPDLREGSNDLATYRRAGEAILRGEIPYRDFFLEYPPGSLPAFVPPALFSADKPGYIALFSSEMALALVATLVLTALAARRLGGERAWVVPAATLAAGGIMLYPVAVTRYDAVVALSLASAVLCASYGRRYLAYASLGLGAAVKLVPALATVPLAVFRHGASRGYTAFVGVIALFFVPALMLGGSGFVGSFAYHADRGVQVESLTASALMAAGRVSEVVFEYGAFEVRGPGAGLAGDLSLAVTGVLLVSTTFFMWLAHRRGSGPRAFPRYAAALILAFMLGSKVLSPQYVIWLLPLIPLGAGGLPGLALSAAFLAACYLTTQVFPTHYDDLLSLRAPGPELLLTRNLLLVLLWGLLLWLPGGRASAKGAS